MFLKQLPLTLDRLTPVSFAREREAVHVRRKYPLATLAKTRTRKTCATERVAVHTRTRVIGVHKRHVLMHTLP